MIPLFRMHPVLVNVVNNNLRTAFNICISHVFPDTAIARQYVASKLYTESAAINPILLAQAYQADEIASEAFNDPTTAIHMSGDMA